MTCDVLLYPDCVDDQPQQQDLHYRQRRNCTGTIELDVYGTMNLVFEIYNQRMVMVAGAWERQLYCQQFFARGVICHDASKVLRSS